MGNAIDIILTTHLTPDNHNLVSKSIFCQKKSKQHMIISQDIKLM